MASPTTATHGKLAAIYRLRPNGFEGTGLNDLTWGAGYSGGASAYYELDIVAEGEPDTFKWRKNSGEWSDPIEITGAAQTLDEGQTVTFGATTGHTATNEWNISHLKDEATTESGADAQITETTRQILNANAVPTFSDSGGKVVTSIDLVTGTAHFSGNVTVVTVTGNNGWIRRYGIDLVAYAFNWHFTAECDLAVIRRFQQHWVGRCPGQARAEGGAEGYFIGGSSFFDALAAREYFLLELFNYEPDGDRSGDHFAA